MLDLEPRLGRHCDKVYTFGKVLGGGSDCSGMRDPILLQDFAHLDSALRQLLERDDEPLLLLWRHSSPRCLALNEPIHAATRISSVSPAALMSLTEPLPAPQTPRSRQALYPAPPSPQR